MGVFVEFEFQKPLYCGICGTEHKTVQSHIIPDMHYFKPEQSLPKQYLNMNLIKEELLYCLDKKHPEHAFPTSVFILIELGVYKGVYSSKHLAYQASEENELEFIDWT